MKLRLIRLIKAVNFLVEIRVAQDRAQQLVGVGPAVTIQTPASEMGMTTMQQHCACGIDYSSMRTCNEPACWQKRRRRKGEGVRLQ
ncbi:MAG: hypothetical protein AAB602_01665 [Patescibacteria group bacterium]